MGLGSYFLFINATPWPFYGFGSHSVQMSNWKWPNQVPAGHTSRVYIEEAGGDASNAGSISYSLNKTDKHFEIQYQALSSADPSLDVLTTGFDMLGTAHGKSTPLSWIHNQDAPFILASSDTDLDSARFVGSQPPVNWMATTLDRTGCLQLRELVLPGTHDSGMSTFHEGTGLAIEGNTKTQEQNIAGQLYWGARWFDIRPVIAGGHWTTGHYSWGCIPVINDCRWRGGNGQSIGSIIEQINAFTTGAGKSELIILHFGGGLNTDSFDGDQYNHLTQANWVNLFTQLLSINHLVKGVLPSQDLTKLNISSFIGPGKGAAVIVVVEDLVADGKTKSTTKVDVRAYISKGIFNGTQFPLVNQYANKDAQDDVIADQVGKLYKYRTIPQSIMFLLSWTVTMQGFDLADPKGIIGLARDFNTRIYEKLWEVLTRTTYPNVLMLDAYPKNGDIIALALAVNYHFARKCPRLNTAPKSSTSSKSLTSSKGSSTSKSSTISVTIKKTSSSASRTFTSSMLKAASEFSQTSSSPTKATSSSASQTLTISVASISSTASESSSIFISHTQTTSSTLSPSSSDLSTTTSTSTSASTSAPTPIPTACLAPYLTCSVQDPTRIEAPWAGVSAPFPQCYDPDLYSCADDFLCPIDAPKIPGEFACDTIQRQFANAILCVYEGTC